MLLVHHHQVPAYPETMGIVAGYVWGASLLGSMVLMVEGYMAGLLSNYMVLYIPVLKCQRGLIMVMRYFYTVVLDMIVQMTYSLGNPERCSKPWWSWKIWVLRMMRRAVYSKREWNYSKAHGQWQLHSIFDGEWMREIRDIPW